VTASTSPSRSLSSSGDPAGRAARGATRAHPALPRSASPLPGRWPGDRPALALPYLTVRDAQGFERTVREAAAYRRRGQSPICASPGRTTSGAGRPLTTARKIPSPGGFRAGRRDHRPARLAAAPRHSSAHVLIALVAFVVALGPTWHPARTAPARRCPTASSSTTSPSSRRCASPRASASWSIRDHRARRPSARPGPGPGSRARSPPAQRRQATIGLTAYWPSASCSS